MKTKIIESIKLILLGIMIIVQSVFLFLMLLLCGPSVILNSATIFFIIINYIMDWFLMITEIINLDKEN